MGICIWDQHPPFKEEDLTPGEKIYEINGKWVVTDQGPPTQEQIDAVLSGQVTN